MNITSIPYKMKAIQWIWMMLIMIFSTASFGQKGSIRGRIFDELTGESMIGVTVVIKGTTIGAVSDFDGNYNISAEPGTYDIQAVFISFKTVEINEVTVRSGEVTVLEDIIMMEAIEQLKEVVVTAEVLRGSETAISTIRKRSATVLDGVSAQSFRQKGDNNVAQAMKRIPGVSVQDGKYVYVRGLGDRYTKSTLNGVDIPGLDPDRNTIQMDIFPTSIIDNIIIYKTFAGDLPADFTGGVVNIETKEFPEKKQTTVSASIGFNPDMHFNKDYLSYQGGSFDWIGKDDGTRNLPIDKRTRIPLPAENDPLTTDLTKSFSRSLAAQKRQASFLNYNFSLTHGNQIVKEKVTWGYNASISYRNTTQFFEGVQFNTFKKNENSREQKLRTERLSSGDLGINNVLLSVMAGAAMKLKRSKYILNFLHIQNGEDKAGYFLQRNFILNSNTIFKDNLEYSERSISNVLLSGTHYLDGGDWSFVWKLSPTIARIEDKDVRVTPYRYEDGEFSIEPSEAGDPVRLWRNLEEVNMSVRGDATRKWLFAGKNSKFRFGIWNVTKQRNFEILNYRLSVRKQSEIGLTGFADELMFEENIWTVQNDVGTSIAGNFEPSNSYGATSNTFAFYASNEFPFTNRFKGVIGLRAEKYDQYYTGQDQLSVVTGGRFGRTFENEHIINSFKLFPSVNLIYALTPKSNLRVSFTKTIARPSFKEASIAQIFDPLSSRTFIGNINLVETDIQNLDLRYETFWGRNQMFSIGGFYKYFSQPIELVAFSEAAPDNFQPRNVGDAQVLGAELEFKKNFDFVSHKLENLSFLFNSSIIYSQVRMDKSPGGEYESRVNNARGGEIIKDTRPMQGQAPYLVNLGLNYATSSGWDLGMYYNVQGKRLAIVGIGPNPDIYDIPFNSLKLLVSKSFGKDKKSRIGFQVSNILDDDLEKRYQSYQNVEETFSLYKPRREYKIRFSYGF